MSEHNINVPKIRFPGFTDAWEQRKMKTMLDERNEQIPENEEYALMSFVQEIGVTPKDDRYDRSFLVKDDNKKYKKTELGDFIYSSNNLETGSIGFNRTGKAVISPVYSIFSSKNELESQFIGVLSTRKKFINKMIHYRQGVVYGQWRIHEKDFLNIEIAIPSYEEQKKIIDLFNGLDDLITLHQSKLNHLQDEKKGLLQKMFPKNGKDFPELRFPGFTDAWEQRRLVEYTKLITKGTTPKDKSGKGDINFVKVENISDGKITPIAKISKDEHETYLKRSILEKDDILFSIAGTLGRTAVVDGSILPANTNQALAIIRGYKFDTNYLITILGGRVVTEYIRKNPTVGAQPNLSLKQVGNLVIDTPSIKEQKKIGAFFKQLDHLITLHQRKLEHLQDRKKALLQQMFI